MKGNQMKYAITIALVLFTAQLHARTYQTVCVVNAMGQLVCTSKPALVF